MQQNGLVQPVKIVDEDTELNINKDGSIDAQFKDSPNVDAFGRLRVGEPFGLFENKFLTGLNSTIWEYRVWGAIMVHGAVTGTGIVVGNTFTGGTSGRKGIIRSIIDANSFTYDTSDATFGSNNNFIDTELVTTSNGSTFTITSSNTGASYSYNYDTSSVKLTTRQVAGQRVVVQTIRYFPYYSGHSHQSVMTGTFEPKVNTKQYIMYGDDLNGVGFMHDGVNIHIFKRTSTSGSPDDTATFSQANWNMDKMDGSKGAENPSGLTIDPTKSLIFVVDFQYLGVGRIRFGFDIGGTLHYVHQLNHSNLSVGVFMKTPTLPVRYEIINTGVPASDTSLEAICSTVTSEGGLLLPGYEFSVPPIAVSAETAVDIANGVVPVLLIRLKNNLPTGKPNRKTVRFLDVKFIARSNNCFFELAHVHDPTVVATWLSADASSAVEYATSITSLTGIHIHSLQEDYVLSGTGQTGTSGNITSEFINNHGFISQNYESNNSQIFAVFAKSFSGISNVWSHISWIEFE